MPTRSPHGSLSEARIVLLSREVPVEYSEWPTPHAGLHAVRLDTTEPSVLSECRSMLDTWLYVH